MVVYTGDDISQVSLSTPGKKAVTILINLNLTTKHCNLIFGNHMRFAKILSVKTLTAEKLFDISICYRSTLRKNILHSPGAQIEVGIS